MADPASKGSPDTVRTVKPRVTPLLHAPPLSSLDPWPSWTGALERRLDSGSECGGELGSGPLLSAGGLRARSLFSSSCTLVEGETVRGSLGVEGFGGSPPPGLLEKPVPQGEGWVSAEVGFPNWKHINKLGSRGAPFTSLLVGSANCFLL